MDTNSIKYWHKRVKTELEQPYFKLLQSKVEGYRIHGDVYPPDAEVFKAFENCPIDNLKVVILGQDPYHGLGQANGLAFSVNHGIAIPPSLRNIFKELHQEKISSELIDGNLELWSNQGVFLLNAVLTVNANQANSHKGIGWERFTDSIIRLISEEKDHVIFMLWGGAARSKKKLVDGNKHLVLESGHPSPLSANRGLWFGNNHFQRANEQLKNWGLQAIRW